MRRGIGRFLPKKFNAGPNVRPEELFNVYTAPKLQSLTKPYQILVYTDGACLNNEKSDPRAGWALKYAPFHIVSGHLEHNGPFGTPSIQSSNHAELRAVIAALRYAPLLQRQGSGPKPRISSVVFATDSECVVQGATEWAKQWMKKGCISHNGQAARNRDLWESLLGEAERWEEDDREALFWRIPREWNEWADEAAKIAAVGRETEKFTDSHGAWIW